MDLTISTALHAFERDFPARSSVKTIQEEQLVMRAVEAYRFFYPTVSAEAIYHGHREAGIEDNKSLMALAAGPRHVGFTVNSDTPYGSGVLDVGAAGPIVIDLPAGPFIGLVNDHHQRWVVDMGIPGPDAGKGGKYILLPPGFVGKTPDGHHAARTATFKNVLAIRAMPHGGDVAGALAALHQIKVYALATPKAVLPFVDHTDRAIDTSPLRWETTIEYWTRLHDIIQDEPVLDAFRPLYGALASFGLVKGRTFAPEQRMKELLETAAQLALDEMRVVAFASERPDRLAWADRKWEWVTLVPDDPNFETKNFLDLEARDRWFVQAIGMSPAMIRRQAGGGSVYWLAARDSTGAYLDGGKTYTLAVPQPVPAGLFWSVTAYDAKTRSQVVTPQDKAVLTSLKDKLVPGVKGDVELYFGPAAPKGMEQQWIQTAPGHGYFLYFRVYGPKAGALDGSWKPGDVLAS